MKAIVRIHRQLQMVLVMVLCIARAGCTAQPAVRRATELTAEVALPARWCGDIAFVDVTIDGKGPYTFLLDTGCPFPVVSQRVARELGAISPLRADQVRRVRRMSPRRLSGRRW